MFLLKMLFILGAAIWILLGVGVIFFDVVLHPFTAAFACGIVAGWLARLAADIR